MGLGPARHPDGRLTVDLALTDEMEMFGESVRGWVDKEAPKSYARELERHEHDYPFELWNKLTDAGFHAITVEEEYGGQGGDVMMQTILARELARSLAGLSWVWGITSFAGAKSIGLYGSDEQKQRFLPQIVEGKVRFAIGFTEPGGGTDLLGAMRTSAKRVDGGWVINGSKAWCTSGHVADYILLLARTDDDVAKRHQGLTLFLVPTQADGMAITEIPKLGMRALGSCDVGLDDVFVPDELVLGEPGNAWYMLLPTLNNERLMLSAFCVGILDGILEDALAFVQEREAFGKKVGQFQILQHYIADIAIARRQSELMVHHGAWKQANGIECFQDTTMAKIVASEAAVRCADLGIQILGGMGYSAETDMQRYWRDARLFRIGPISNEMARNALAESLGLPRSF
jgi:alkylation response protein AidB-like acyl-CoA dehydrogenase